MAGVAVFKLKHIGINKQLTIPVVVSSFETTAKPNWASDQVYGRMDPIFTYQNTVRKFTAVLRTPRSNERFTKEQYEVFTSAAGGKSTTAFEQSGTKYIYIAGSSEYLRDIADLYKMMYPVYFPLDVGKRAAAFLTAAPLLTINLSGIAHDGMAQSADLSLRGAGTGLLFVPETFKVNSLVDSQKASITVRSAEDLKFFANTEGYTITLGGTIVHRHNRVGFYERGDKIVFMQGREFPYSTGNRSKFWGPGDAAAAGYEGRMAQAAADRCTAATAAMDALMSGKGPEQVATTIPDPYAEPATLDDALADLLTFEERLDIAELESATACGGGE